MEALGWTVVGGALIAWLGLLLGGRQRERVAAESPPPTVRPKSPRPVRKQPARLWLDHKPPA